MGGHDISTILPGDLTEADLRKQFSILRDEAAFEKGHSAYSGSWNTLRGLRVIHTVFPSQDEAFRYVMDNAEKWQDALAVRFRSTKKVTRKEPTYAGKPRSFPSLVDVVFDTRNVLNSSGMLLDPYPFVTPQGATQDGKWVMKIVPADQLTPAQQVEAYSVGRTYWNADVALREARGVLEAFCKKLNPPWTPEEVPAWLVLKPDWAALKKLHTNAAKAVRALQKAKAAMDKLHARLSPGLVAVEDVDEGERWLVGGIAAS